MIPLRLVGGPSGPLLTVDVTIGNKTIPVAIDTVTVGLRVAGSGLDSSSITRTGVQLGASVRRGQEAYADVTIAGQHIQRLQIDVMDSVQGMIGSPAPGLLGIGLLSLPRGLGCCANPLAALPAGIGNRYILSASLRSPQLILDPDEQKAQQFAMVPVGTAGFAQGCVTIDQIITYQLCGPVILNSSARGITIYSANQVERAGNLPTGAVAHLRLAQWDHDFTAQPGLPISIQIGSGSGIQLGLSALQQIDVLYDAGARQLGFRSQY